MASARILRLRNHLELEDMLLGKKGVTIAKFLLNLMGSLVLVAIDSLDVYLGVEKVKNDI